MNGTPNHSAQPRPGERFVADPEPAARPGWPQRSAVRQAMKRAWRPAFVCLLAGAVVWFIVPRSSLPENLAIAPGGSDEEAAALVTRLLQTNKVWLKPGDVQATYSLRRSYRSSSLGSPLHREQQTAGPFFVGKGCRQSLRVGSQVVTPLHSMLQEPAGYTVRMVGRTRLRNKEVVVVDVMFGSAVRCAIGLGDQEVMSFNCTSYLAEQARILIDSSKAVPLFLQTVFAVTNKSTWDFTSGFYRMEGGWAPRSFTWTGSHPWFIPQRQDFQVKNGVWMFKQGAASWNQAWLPTVRGKGLVDKAKANSFDRQVVEMVGLKIQTADAMSAEPVAAPEPPPRASCSDAQGDGTLDSLPAAGSGGGR